MLEMYFSCDDIICPSSNVAVIGRLQILSLTLSASQIISTFQSKVLLYLSVPFVDDFTVYGNVCVGLDLPLLFVIIPIMPYSTVKLKLKN